MTYLDETNKIKVWLKAGSINIFGRPFAGKDTQGRLLAELFDGTLLGGGDILRASTLPNHVEEAMRAGELIPTEEYIQIVLPFLSKQEHSARPLILSSVGRWSGEENGVIEATKASEHPMKAVIYLELNEDQVCQRWNNLHETSDRGLRHDDTAEVLEARLNEYRNKTLPVLAHYKAMGLLVTIDGSQTPEVVHEEILAKLFELAN